MADNKKYYYMRLKENFFDSDAIVLLESLPDGVLYSNILLKMYLKSLKNNGLLMVNDLIPYNTNMIATITRHPVGVVEKALEVFRQLNLIDVLESGAIYMSDIELFIGQSSTEAERKKLNRQRVLAVPDKCRTNVGQMSTIDRDIYRDIDKDKDIDIEIDKESEGSKTKRFVPPTLEEVKEYIASRGNKIDAEKFYYYYDARNWELSKGRKVKKWKSCVITWEKEQGKYEGKKNKIEINEKQREGMNDVIDWGM